MVTILPISTTTSHLQPLNTTNPSIFADAHPAPDLGHAQHCGGVKQVIWDSKPFPNNWMSSRNTDINKQ